MIEIVTADAVDLMDPTFDAAREAYPGFDGWARRVAAERRPCHVARGPRGLLAVAVLKVGCGDAKLCSMAVRADVRGRGIGAAVMRSVLAAHPAESIRTTVPRDRPGAIAFLVRHGFVDVGEARDGEARLVRPARAPMGSRLPRTGPAAPGDGSDR